MSNPDFVCSICYQPGHNVEAVPDCKGISRLVSVKLLYSVQEDGCAPVWADCPKNFVCEKCSDSFLRWEEEVRGSAVREWWRDQKDKKEKPGLVSRLYEKLLNWVD